MMEDQPLSTMIFYGLNSQCDITAKKNALTDKRELVSSIRMAILMGRLDTFANIATLLKKFELTARDHVLLLQYVNCSLHSQRIKKYFVTFLRRAFYSDLPKKARITSVTFV